MNGNLYPKNNKSLEIYRGDTLQIIFTNIPSIDTGIVTIEFQVRKEPYTTLLIQKTVLSSDDGNDWNNGIVAVNLSSGQTQLVPPDTLYRYDLRITRDGDVNADYFGNLFLVGDISGTGTVVTPIVEADIYATLAGTNTNEGASLIGVLSSFWTSILGGGNEILENAIQWLYTNTLKVISPFTANRVLKSGASSGDVEVSGITIDSSDNIDEVGNIDLKSGSLYYINGSQLSTSSIVEGSNLYYTTTRFNTDFATKTTTDLAEGTNLYYLDSRVLTYIKTILTTSGDMVYRSGSNIVRLPIGTNGDVLTITAGLPVWSSAAAATTFLGLSDTPNSYTGEGSKLVRVNSGETALEFTDTFADQIIIVEDQKSNTTNGGTFTSGADRTRDLNTVIVNTITGASLSSNQVTLPAGTYEILESFSNGYRVDGHKIKVKNITDSIEYIGSNAFASSSTGVSTSSTIKGHRFTIASSKVFELQHRCDSTKSTDGFGYALSYGSVEIYSRLGFKKIG